MANTVCQGECNFFAVNCPGELSNFTTFTFKYFLEIIISIYGFKKHNFVSENIIFESKTCLHNGIILKEPLAFFTSCECYIRRVERLCLLPTDIKTEKIVDDNENKRGQKYPL